MAEPQIRINGELLTAGEAMTVRVALECFALDLSREGLGDDENGKAMTAAYLSNIVSIRRKMHGSTGNEGEQ